MQKAVLKQQFEAFTISSKESLEKGYDRFQKLLSQLEALGAGVSDEDANHKFLRSLPPAWDSLAMTMRTKKNIDTLSIDDLYNNLSVFEQDIQKTSSSSQASENVAFISQAKASSSKHKPSQSSGSYSSYTTSSSKAKPTATPGLADEVIHSFLPQTLMIKVEMFNMAPYWGILLGSASLKVQKKVAQEAGRGQDFKPVRTEKEALMTIDEGQINWVEQTTDEELISSNCFSLEQEDIDDSLYEYGKYGPQPQSPSPIESDASSTVSSTCQSNDSDGEQGIVSDHSVNDDSIPIPSCEQVTTSTQKTQPQVPKPQQTVEPSCAQHVKTPRQPIRTPVTPSPIPSYNRQNWNQRMERELGAGYSFERKPCFVCGSLSHLIKDCDYYETKMAREAAFKSTRVVHANIRQATPAWTNSNRVNKANQFTPRPVQLNNIRPNFSTASRTIKTGRVNVNTGKQNVSSGSLHVSSGTHIKSGASSFNTGKSNCLISVECMIIPQKHMEHRVLSDSGCSGHMTVTRAHLKISRTFQSGYLLLFGGMVKICDKKLNVLFTEKECFVVSSDFKMPDENQDTLVLSAKASSNELKLWHKENVPTNPTLQRIHNAHPQVISIGLPNTPVQTRSLSRDQLAHALVSYMQAQQRSNHKDQQHCLFACFLSQSEPKKVSEALEDASWVEAMQEELLHAVQASNNVKSAITHWKKGLLWLKMKAVPEFCACSRFQCIMLLANLDKEVTTGGCHFLTENPVYHSKTKHIEIRHHFIRDCYEKKLIQVQKIHTDLNVADLLTKPFDGPSPKMGSKINLDMEKKMPVVTCQLDAIWLSIFQPNLSIGALKYCDKEAQSSISYSNPQECCGYTEKVDFLQKVKIEGSALTHKPPSLTDSPCQAFWQTATARNIADGFNNLMNHRFY
ncbi:hypothetical protein Tco_1321250 [Tanacetum coccineum]